MAKARACQRAFVYRGQTSDMQGSMQYLRSRISRGDWRILTLHRNPFRSIFWCGIILASTLSTNNIYTTHFHSSSRTIMAANNTMKAVVIHTKGGPEVLKVEQRPIPTAKPGQVLIRVKAFGLNRSEMFTRQGHSPGVDFPRTLGIEATGIVEHAPGGEFEKGQIVMTAMGGMGRQFDGGYAQYTVVPTNQVQAITVPTKLGWDVLGAMPEMLNTAYGAITKSLNVKKGDRLLIRGGTTSVGLAALAIAKGLGAHVTSTSRRPERESMLREYGADEFFVDDGAIAEQIKDEGQKFDKVLELVGVVTLKDSLNATAKGGVVSLVGIVGNSWNIENFQPQEFIPKYRFLTTFGGWIEEFMDTPLNDIVQQVEDGTFKIKVGKVFHIDQIAEAHQCMDDNAAEGKIVVLTG
ncbi:zinc-binding oxidoreductase, putative [Talaromyces stipitatus ATCC 10500]|uniref:Zinc-binding oxidoreductase, putative n=1 Tax=Talaromyces stipitatus (strain ATCC 10500 / CBS 375.48 / QM 6759 / NRRL 1006) TaxID=441959 RepID=B8MAT1_TALSN|nr:zinc-binding oxidoreductase, putative [Talaromyces stipitatus ATCC 10500]EED17771.1 zinc-binding oxidoreductase, putative [Talaromyces stipitatus ATCC 10500]